MALSGSMQSACFGNVNGKTDFSFVSNRDGYWEIYVMDADGSNPRKLSNDHEDFIRRGPVWQPQLVP